MLAQEMNNKEIAVTIDRVSFTVKLKGSREGENSVLCF